MKIKKQGKEIYLLFTGPKKEAKDHFSDFVPSGLFNILYYLLKNGYEPKLYNLSGFKEKEKEDFVKSSGIDIAFISTFMGNHNQSFKLAALIKKYHKNAVTVLGGPFGVLGDEILKRVDNIDFVIKGEGELAALKLIGFLEGKETLEHINGLCYRTNIGVCSNKPVFHTNIDEFFYLPSQIKSYCNYVKKENFAILITSRGCPFRCNFCSSPVLWKNRIRYHNLNNIIAYVKDLRATTNQIYFSIRDDNFLMNRERVKAFVTKLVKENLYFLWNTQGSVAFIDDELCSYLADGGCDQVQLGIESASERLLNFFNKDLSLEKAYKVISALRKHLIKPFGYFIAGLEENPEELKKTCDFIKKSGLMDGIVSPLVIYPGTKLSSGMSTDIFFSEKEILYYSQQSFEKYKKEYIKALEYVFHNKGFTIKEIKNSPTTSFLKTVVTYYYLLSEGRKQEALEMIKRLPPQNPWRKRLPQL